jgi:aspartokinase-like uncharacterized kinase
MKLSRKSRAGRTGGAPRFDLVVKVGGSLGRGRTRLRALLRHLAGEARRGPLLVVPGGGVFADLVRGERRRLRLDAASAHRMALRATDQFGLLLAALHPRGEAVIDLEAARRAGARGRLPILLPGALVEREPALERTFRLTSDAIAAWVAGRAGARRLLVLKSVRGLDRLAANGGDGLGDLARRGVVDPLFARHLAEGTAVRVIDARLVLGARLAFGPRPPPPAPARRSAPAGAKSGRRAPLRRGRRARR